MNEKRKRSTHPLYQDVVFGRGGLSGLFTRDSSEVTGYDYVANSGTAQSGSSTSITLAAAASAVDDFYNGMGIVITGGTGSGQDHLSVLDYDGTTKVATTSDWVTVPDSTSTYRIVDRET